MEIEIVVTGVEIETVISDVDGCLTDNTVIYPDRLRVFNVSDGHGFQMLQGAGIECYIFSGEGDTSIWSRAHKLGIEFHPTPNKLQTALNLGIDLSKAAFLGNDVMDLPLLREAALPACPHDAAYSVLEYCCEAGWVSRYDGGRGVFRELAEFILG